LLFMPMSIYLGFISAVSLILFFTIAAVANFYFHHIARHNLAFYSFTFSGYIYFFFATILFGLDSNIQYFYLVLCMISSVIFEKKGVLLFFIFLAILLFFSLLWIMHNKPGLVIISDELKKIQDVVALFIAFFLFAITAIFFIFFKTENSRYQLAILEQKHIIEEKHKEITDSINYAERIQRSFLATKSLLDENLKEYFVLFKPKDVVSGDFYWASKLNNGNFALCCADSTGHGVPGAIMSIANIACLKESVTKGLIEPDQILNETRRLVIDYLKNDGSKDGGKDGMDASLICFDFENKLLQYASANNPIWLARLNTETNAYSIIECPADKMPVGKHDKQNIPFTANEIQLISGDVIYALTDGLPDQFGGEKGKKFMHKRLKNFLCSNANLPMNIQEQNLKKAFFDWKGELEQVDDICLIGVRI